MTTEKLTKLNQSVEKALQIIELMVDERHPMRLQDIAEQSGMPASTVLRMVNTLLVHGYINQNSDNMQYSLSLKFAQLGSRVSEQVSILQISHPLLTELSCQCGELACLAVEQDHEAVYVDVVDCSENMLKTTHRIGARAPLYSTGIGKILLLNYSEAELDAYIKERGLSKRASNTVAGKKELLEKLLEIRQNGYSLDNEENEAGVRSVAAPIWDYTGRIVGGISVPGPTARLTMERIQEIIPIIKDVAMRISKFLAYNG